MKKMKFEGTFETPSRYHRCVMTSEFNIFLKKYLDECAENGHAQDLGVGVGGVSENAHLKQVKQDRKYTTNTTYTYHIPGHK